MKMFGVFCICVLLFSSCQTIQERSLKPNLQGEWLFDNNVNDSSGNNQNGIMHNISYVQNRYNEKNKAVEFNGMDSYIEFPYKVLESDNSFSISYWAYLNKTGDGYREVVSWWDDSILPYERRAFWGVNNTIQRFGDVWSDTGVEIPMNQWFHIVVLFSKENKRISLVLNGETVGIRNINNTFEFKKMYVGRQGALEGEYWSGDIDDLKIYNRALSNDEIRYLYESKK